VPWQLSLSNGGSAALAGFFHCPLSSSCSSCGMGAATGAGAGGVASSRAHKKAHGPLKARFTHRPPHSAPSSGFNCELRRYCAASNCDDDRYCCLCPAARVAILHSDSDYRAPNAEAIEA